MRHGVMARGAWRAAARRATVMRHGLRRRHEQGRAGEGATPGRRDVRRGRRALRPDEHDPLRRPGRPLAPAHVRALQLLPGQKVLDVAAGTGVSTHALAATGAWCVATDFSFGMLSAAKADFRLPRVAGDALHLPFADGTFDAVTISFGLRNVEDPGAALREFARVTRPGGQLLVCEFSRPRPRRSAGDTAGTCATCCRCWPAGCPPTRRPTSTCRRPSTPGPTSRRWPG